MLMSHSLPLLIMNGPNLGKLGVRQPEIYGDQGLEAIPSMIERLLGGDAGRIALSFFQSNHEGALIDRLEQAKTEGCLGIILNAGAFTHTSLALADCLAWIKIPTVEVHLSNILARKEEIRHASLLAPHVIGVIAGFGLMSYALAVQAILEHLGGCEKTPLAV